MYDSDITSESPARKKIRLSNKSDADGEAIPKNHELLVAVTAQHADKIKSEHYEKPSEILTPRGDIGAEDDEVGKDVGSASKFRNSYSSDSDTDGEEVADFADTSSANPDQDAGVSATESAKIDRHELFKLTQHRSLIKSLKTELRMLQPSLKPDKLEELLDMIRALKEKYKKATDWMSRKQSKNVRHPATREDFITRFRGNGKEEAEHPWLPAAELDPNIPDILMRAWDEISQCQIRDYRVGCLSGSSACMLDTFAKRKLALTRHSDWGNRFKTPFISSSSSLHEIAKERVPHFQQRQFKKGIKDNTKLTLFNTRARRALGKPVLRLKDELLYHNVRTKYGDPRFTAGSFFENEYLLPFSAGPDEIIGTWAWHQVEAWIKNNHSNFQGWYEQVGLPAFKEHERLKLGGLPNKCKAGCDCCGQ